MTPKEKAKDLYKQFLDIGLIVGNEAKQCALIAVDELIRNSFPGVIKNHWEQVKQEIQAL